MVWLWAILFLFTYKLDISFISSRKDSCWSNDHTLGSAGHIHEAICTYTVVAGHAIIVLSIDHHVGRQWHCGAIVGEDCSIADVITHRHQDVAHSGCCTFNCHCHDQAPWKINNRHDDLTAPGITEISLPATLLQPLPTTQDHSWWF